MWIQRDTDSRLLYKSLFFGWDARLTFSTTLPVFSPCTQIWLQKNESWKCFCSFFSRASFCLGYAKHLSIYRNKLECRERKRRDARDQRDQWAWAHFSSDLPSVMQVLLTLIKLLESIIVALATSCFGSMQRVIVGSVKKAVQQTVLLGKTLPKMWDLKLFG